MHLRVRRFFCDADGCARKTFAEQVPGLTVYLTARWNAGVTSTRQLHQELRERGVVVSERTIRRFLIHLRAGRSAAQLSVDPTRREVTRSITRHPDDVDDDDDDDDKIRLKELCDRCPDLDSPPANGSLPSSTYSSTDAAAQRWRHGSSGPRHAPCLSYAATPPACAPTGTRSPPVSPTRGAPARLKGRSTASK
ncbi:hypothetical protein BBK14_32120 [Parafrankia soli]|uniref:Uncharacterized protein n=1 Tax=Parafrankia soli TaxID=2599596 RepID=A0A1S1R6W4_9ACTN|nr:hypothetical protein BBK14_32120 [Parafrankia soli]